MDRKLVLSLPLMWIFRKRAFSVSKDFGFFLGKEKDDRPHGQIDLIEKKSIFKWYLVGFWADIDGKYNTWSIELSCKIFWDIRSSDEFTIKNKLHT